MLSTGYTHRSLRPAGDRHRPDVLRMDWSVLQQIYHTIGTRRAEHGGVLGGDRATGTVTQYYYDHSASRTGGTYSPDHVVVNRLFAEHWNPEGINLIGFVHSHPAGCRHPSGGDLVYARRILDAIPELPHLVLPIVMTEPDTNRFELLPFRIVRDGDDVRVEEMRLVATVVNDVPETFRRVAGAYDLERLMNCRVVYVGVGGAADFAEQMARAGTGQHVLIDGDLVAETNLATQQTYRKDIGRSKVDAIDERIRDINPTMVVVPCRKMLDEIDDAEFERLALGPIDGRLPHVTLLCGFTDDFFAQARLNRLALQLGLPSLCAQLYQEGRALELTFTHPETTPACHRCILSSRYRAYLEEDYRNAVTSDGTPIFATTRLNALKGLIAMALLHHGMSPPAPLVDATRASMPRDSRWGHERWNSLLERIGKRNLIQVRLDPDSSFAVFGRVFGGGDQERILFDEAVWLPQDPENPDTGHPPCPDCGGTGDLRNAIDTFEDTRQMRR